MLTKRGRETEPSQVASSSEHLDLNVDDGNKVLPNETEDRKKMRKDSYKCTFLSSWKLSYPWAYSLIDNDRKERMKCTLCVEAKEKGFFANEGNVNIQKGALHDHAISKPHRNAVSKLAMLAKMPETVIEKHVELMIDSEKNRIVTVMQVLWDKVVSDGSIESFEHAYGGFGSSVTRFVRLVRIKDGKAQSMFNAIMDLFADMQLDKKKLVGFASDGASSMVGIREGLVAKLRSEVPHLVGIHCIVHRENLAVKDACEQFVEFVHVDKFANKVREWIGHSTLRREELCEVYDAFHMKHYQILQMHGVRWLSRGHVMMRSVKIMPALLTNWSGKYPKMYEKATVFQVQFLVHFLADLLEQVNMLNLMFQKEHVDITLIGREIDACITLLSTMYLGQKFGDGSKCLKKFLKDAEGGELKYTDESENVHVHKLHFKSLPNSSNLGTLDACIEIGKEFVNALLFSLNERFFDNSIFNAAKLFSPRNYPSDIKDRGQFAKDRLGNLCAKFCVGNSSLVDKEHCE
ncbi:hypothetical protein L7F22_014084, partial [Adiantum nelumboides]|nr:hypothetical protein [Adiantum nelumboides]